MENRFYIFNSGSLVRQDDSLVFKTKNKKSFLPIKQIESIYIYGNCNMNKQVLLLLEEYNICLYYFSYYGKYIGSFVPNKRIVGDVIIKQVRTFDDFNSKLQIHKEILLSSIHNMIFVLKYYEKKRSEEYKEIKEIEKNYYIIKNLKNDVNNYNIYMAIEAKIKKIYYSLFNRIINNKDFEFVKRSSYPPQDEINCLMSFGYSLLYGVCDSAIYHTSLCPSISFIHGISKRNNGLSYDIADIFKPIIIDRIIFRMINKNQINKKDFNIKNGGVFMKKEIMKLFIKEFDNILESTISVKNKKMSYRSIILQEFYNLEKFIRKEKIYKGFKMKL